jgi:N-acetylglucosaminyldiphosphoundecaprenol N-acetyl-beta-D-mannosaminyltransferase
MFSLFHVPLDSVTITDVLRRIDETRTHPFWIVTANPEILLEARRRTAYRDALQRANLRIVDGIGIVLAAFLQGKRVVRVTGVELAEAFVQRAWSRHERVCLLGGGNGVAEHAAQKLRNAYTGLRVHAFHGGTVSHAGVGDDTNDEALHQIILTAPHVLLVAFGHPKQEAWIAAHVHELPPHCIVMGVGGTLDYWSDRIPRAPQWMRRIGLEWLYRLIKEPRRWKRIWNAVVVFPISFVMIDSRFRGNDN